MRIAALTAKRRKRAAYVLHTASPPTNAGGTIDVCATLAADRPLFEEFMGTNACRWELVGDDLTARDVRNSLRLAGAGAKSSIPPLLNADDD